MKLKIGLAVIALGLLMSGCNKQASFGKLDKTPYATKECRKTLSVGAEIDHSNKIDKIVVYKKKRTLYTYRNGKKINTFRFSLGKNGNKGNKVKAGDYRTPEGSYVIVRKKCDDRLYRSLMISYPNAEDGAYANNRSARKAGKWNHARKYCSRLNYAGYSDWRLPTSDELTAVHRIDGQVFRYSRDKDFWTSTPTTEGKYYVIYPADAYPFKRSKSQSNFIRCVRCTGDN